MTHRVEPTTLLQP